MSQQPEAKKLDEHLTMLGRLASTLSHEIRNPLSAISLHVDILEEELQQPTADSCTCIAKTLTEIKAELARIGDLVQDYLSLARLAGLRHEPAAFGAVVQAFVLEMHEQLKDRGIVLHLQGLADLGQVALHHNAFRRVLLNLVHNAIDAVPPGGTLTFHGRREDSQARLEITDTGCGIPQEQFSLLFTPFHTTKPDGTGLGLYVVQQILTAHGGAVTVTSTPCKGTTCLVTLPLCSQNGSGITGKGLIQQVGRPGDAAGSGRAPRAR